MAKSADTLRCRFLHVAHDQLLPVDHVEQHPLLRVQSRDQDSAVQSFLDLPDQYSGAILLPDSRGHPVLHDPYDAGAVHSASVRRVAGRGYAVHAPASG